VRSGVHPHDAARSLFGGRGSQGNGAAMRVAPVAVRYADDAAALAEAARALVTTTELRDALSTARGLLERSVEPAELAARLGNRATGLESAPAAIYCVAAHESVETAITFAVRCGGDTDTIGAMAGVVAAAAPGVSAIPHRWLAALEERPKGRGHVQRLADRLVAARERG